jgi:hypothetical protein
LSFYALLFAAAFAAGILAYWLDARLDFKPNEDGWLDAFWARFQILAVLSILIERSVEVYLKASGQDGKERVNPQTRQIDKLTDASQPSLLAGLVIGLLVAASGARILNTVADPAADAGLIRSAVWFGVDVLISAGLMAGGASLFHRVAKLIEQVLRLGETTLSRSRALRETAPALPATGVSPTVVLTTGALYNVLIDRPSDQATETGKLTFSDAQGTITATCWWDKGNRVDAGTYPNCSKTTMDKLKIPAIYVAGAKSKTSGGNTIFIHRGAGPENSDGCFAVESNKMEQILGRITPSNGANVTVVIRDV